MAIRVYRYGCLPPAGDDMQQVQKQLRLAHRYRVMLWYVSIASRAQYRARRNEFSPELAGVEQQLSDLQAKLETFMPKEERRLLQPQVKELRAHARLLRNAIKDNKDFDNAVKRDREREHALRIGLRTVFASWGLYWGTYLIIEDADTRSRSGTEDPAKPRPFNGTGALAVQIPGNVTTPQIMSGKHPSLGIVPPQREGKGRRAGSRSTAKFRIGSHPGTRQAHCINLKLMVSRDLPPDARIKWVKLVVARSGATALGRIRLAWSLQLTLDSPSLVRSEFGAGEVAICLADDKCMYAGEFEAPKQFMLQRPFKKIDDLQSIRDKNRNAIVEVLNDWAVLQDVLPPWFADELQAWRNRNAKSGNKISCRRTVYMVTRLLKEWPYSVPADLQKQLREWRYHENHLYQWQGDARAGVLRARKEAYRVFAAELRRKYRFVVLDSRVLSDAKRKTQDTNWRGLYELRQAIKHSFGEDFVIDGCGGSCEELFEGWRASKVVAEKAAQTL